MMSLRRQPAFPMIPPPPPLLMPIQHHTNYNQAPIHVPPNIKVHGYHPSNYKMVYSIVELGASIIYEGNKLVADMISGDPERLVKGKPMGFSKEEDVAEKDKDNTQTKKKKNESEPSGFGIYHGNGEWLVNLSSFGKYSPFIKKIFTSLYLLYRYNFDLLRLRGAVKQAVHSFDMIYDVLNDTQHETLYFDSPMDIWQVMGLRRLAGVSFHDFLDGLGLYRNPELEESDSTTINTGSSWWDWRKWIPGMGCLRSELVTGMTINTYNQDLNEMNGLVGLVAYVPAGGELFSIKGGNHLLMESALWQAKQIYDLSNCKSSENQQRIQMHQRKISTVVASESSLELYEGTESLGKFDVVILAAPLQQAQIQFLVENPMGMDADTLHEMPLGGMKENLDTEDNPQNIATNNEHGQHLFASSLPPSATIPYTSVVTTLVSNATINTTYFGLEDENVPRSILVSERGKLFEGDGITTLTILSEEHGLIKTFSSEPLSSDQRNILFGTDHVVEYEQNWGGQYGGATPNFSGGKNSESLPFLLYDAAKHWSKFVNDGPALYYVNAIESAVAAIEISAIGAKSVAKLVARRLDLIRPKKSVAHDEL